jgi:hypothetical protein
MTPEEQEYIKNIAIIAAGAGVIGGAVVSAVAILFNGWRQRVADAKRHMSDSEAANIRHFRELALEAAVADWKHHLEAAEKWHPRIGQSDRDRPHVDPFDQFLIRKLKLMQVFGDGSISVKDLPAKWAEMAEFIRWIKSPSSSGQDPKIEDSQQGATRSRA